MSTVHRDRPHSCSDQRVCVRTRPAAVTSIGWCMGPALSSAITPEHNAQAQASRNLNVSQTRRDLAHR